MKEPKIVATFVIEGHPGWLFDEKDLINYIMDMIAVGKYRKKVRLLYAIEGDKLKEERDEVCNES